MEFDLKKYLYDTPCDNFFLLAGPCVIENEEMALEIATTVKAVTDRLGIPYVFKGSYRKANRSRLDSFTGIGDLQALAILKKVRETVGVPVVTDIHTADEARLAAEFVDMLQIPAFLCRQTDLLVAAAKTGKMVNIKKGQFLSPEAMKYAVEKVRDAGDDLVAVTERGTTFGYQDLIVDYRGIPEMRRNGCPVILDVTHSLQQPNQSHRRPPRYDRDRGPRRYRRGVRRHIHRDSPEPSCGEERRRQYAPPRPPARTPRTPHHPPYGRQHIQGLTTLSLL